jgi:hypothetical protein
MRPSSGQLARIADLVASRAVPVEIAQQPYLADVGRAHALSELDTRAERSFSLSGRSDEARAAGVLQAVLGYERDRYRAVRKFGFVCKPHSRTVRVQDPTRIRFGPREGVAASVQSLQPITLIVGDE